MLVFNTSLPFLQSFARIRSTIGSIRLINMKRWVKLGILLFWLLSLSNTYAWRELTISKADTLATLAEKYRPDGVTRMDMVIAIRNANPHVFSKASSFKPGTRLLLPSSQAEVRQAIKGKYPALSTPKPVAPANNVTKPVNNVSKAPSMSAKTAAAKSKPAVVKKSVTPSAATLAANQGAITIKSLQDTVSNQTQMIQNYQSQVNQLNAQLNIATQQVQSLQAKVAHQSIWTLENLWLVLWIVTLGLLLFQYFFKSKRSLADEEDYGDDEDETAEPASVQNYEHESTLAYNEAALRQEPQLAMVTETNVKPKTLSENWEQAELDIPTVEEIETTLVREEEVIPPFEKYEDKELAGEQDNLIHALAQDENNMEWHQALLEFYVKTNSQNGFKRHYQTMVKSGIMTEGDPLWEQVRKMYLNKWIYQAI